MKAFHRLKGPFPWGFNESRFPVLLLLDSQGLRGCSFAVSYFGRAIIFIQLKNLLKRLFGAWSSSTAERPLARSCTRSWTQGLRYCSSESWVLLRLVGASGVCKRVWEVVQILPETCPRVVMATSPWPISCGV